MVTQFASLIMRSVVSCYAIWGTVVVTDFAACEARRPGQCDTQRAELRGVATTIPSTLLAWLADSPVSANSGQVSQRKPRQLSNEDR